MSCSKEPIYVCCDDNNASQNAYGGIESIYGQTLTLTANELETVNLDSKLPLYRMNYDTDTIIFQENGRYELSFLLLASSSTPVP